MPPAHRATPARPSTKRRVDRMGVALAAFGFTAVVVAGIGSTQTDSPATSPREVTDYVLAGDASTDVSRGGERTAAQRPTLSADDEQALLESDIAAQTEAQVQADAAAAAQAQAEADAAAAALSMAACASGSAVESGLLPDTIAVHRAVCANFPQISSYGGASGGGEHASGQAIDIMISGQAGWDVANYVRDHHSELGVEYIIYSQQIWSVDRASEGWRPMSDRGGATANHYDHVHVTTYGNVTAG